MQGIYPLRDSSVFAVHAAENGLESSGVCLLAKAEQSRKALLHCGFYRPGASAGSER